MKAPLVIVLLVLLSSLPGLAEDEIVTDRPDIAESALTVGAGRVQLETGLSYEEPRGGGPGRLFTPTLLRVGTGPDTELRLESDGLVWEDPEEGLADLSLGLKWTFHEAETTALGLILTLDVPTGHPAFRAPGAVPAARLAVDADLSDEVGLGLNVGLAVPEDAGGARFLEGSFAASLSRSLSDVVSGYLELSGAGPDGVDGPFLMALDGGLTFLVNPDVQLDVSALRGLSAGGPDWGVGAGVSIRL